MGAKFTRLIIWLAGLFTIGILLFIVLFILWNGLPAMSLDLFAWEYTTRNLSMMPAIISTLIVFGLSISTSAPIGIFTAFYLVEHADASTLSVNWVC